MEKEQIAALVERARSGDGQAMEDLLRLAHTSVSYQCRKIMAHAQDAEDMTQEVLVKVYENLDSLKEPEKFISWANSIAARQCINERKRNPKDLQFAEDEEGNSVLDQLEELDEQKIPRRCHRRCGDLPHDRGTGGRPARSPAGVYLPLLL